ncbi:MAG: glycosyltransferase family 2 protein [Flavobacteriales bacterium]|nr:glycosyltransferase family 2 protein [Flavobacteriales bacterium]
MKVSGFTFIRNAITFDYPIVEAIQSILPLCDEVVVAVGNSDDDTLALIHSIDSNQIRIIETVWDDTLREGGRVLADETDKALAGVVDNCDWCIYIQGDEVLHEDGYAEIRQAMQGNLHREDVDGLLLRYKHFYGSYDYVGASANWYRNEIRIIKPGRGIHSFRDAQGFRKPTNQKLRVVRLEAYMHHYGWVKEPKAMQRKQESFHKMWHDDAWVASNVISSEAYDYGRDLRHLVRFEGTHPKGMQQRIARVNWHFDADISIDQRSIKDRLKQFCYEKLGIELGYKNYLAVRFRNT